LKVARETAEPRGPKVGGGAAVVVTEIRGEVEREGRGGGVEGGRKDTEGGHGLAKGGSLLKRGRIVVGKSIEKGGKRELHVGGRR